MSGKGATADSPLCVPGPSLPGMARLILSSLLVCWSLWMVRPPTAAARTLGEIPASEPTVRVGIVLPEDNMQTMAFQLPAAGKYRIAGGGETNIFQTSRATTCTVELVEKNVCVTVQGIQPRRITGELVVVSPTAAQTLQRGAGLLVRGVLAGRSFHWRTRIDQTLLGSLQFHSKDGRLIVVNELPAEQYLAGVITAEMSGACPVEFLKAQTVAARSWYFAGSDYGKHPGMPFFRCNDDCCQRYQGTGDLSPAAMQAIQETRGEVLATTDSTLLDTNYSKSCGGILADPVRVWGAPKTGQYCGLDAPEGSPAGRFLPITEQNVRDWLTGDWVKRSDIFCSPKVVPEQDLPKYLGRVDVTQSYFRWTVNYSREELTHLLRKKLNLPDLALVAGLTPGARGPSGHLYDLTIWYRTTDGKPAEYKITGQYNIRSALHPSFLYSSAFVIDSTPGPDGLPKEFVLHGGGWGHGAGLCQIGALGMAFQNYPYDKILLHYFRNATIAKRYP